MRSITLLVAADQPGQRAAVRPDPALVGQHLVHLGLGIGAAGDLRPPLGIDRAPAGAPVRHGLCVGVARDHEGGQAESQRIAVPRAGAQVLDELDLSASGRPLMKNTSPCRRPAARPGSDSPPT